VLIVDTNIWLSAADRRSVRHLACLELLAAHRGQLASPVPVIAESSWLILDRLGVQPHHQFLSLVTTGELTAVDLSAAEWLRCVELCDRYRDLRLDVMDAAIVAIAERFAVTTIATMNHRDFAVVRPAHCEAFELVP
jgi:uncharacterized protein